MTTPASENAPRRGWFSREVFEILAGGATVLAAVLYGYGWLVLSRFYGSFDVNPEDVGVTFAFITVRVALVMAALAAASALVILPLRPLARARVNGARVPSIDAFEVVRFLRGVVARLAAGRNAGAAPALTRKSITDYVSSTILAGCGIAFLAGVLLHFLGVDFVFEGYETGNQVVDPPEVAWAWMALVVLTAPVWTGLLIIGFDQLVRRAQRESISLRWPALLLSVLLLTGGCFVLVAGIWLLPRMMADTVRSRDLAATVPFLSVVGLRADGVQTTTLDGGPISPRLPAGCVRLLGSAGGVTVLFDPTRQLLVRVPSERLVVEQPCP